MFSVSPFGALVLAIGGRGCTPTYALGIGFIWLETYTLFGFVYWIPIVAVAACSWYFGTIWMARRNRTRSATIVAALIVIAVFAVAAIVTPPNGRCVYL